MKFCTNTLVYPLFGAEVYHRHNVENYSLLIRFLMSFLTCVWGVGLPGDAFPPPLPPPLPLPLPLFLSLLPLVLGSFLALAAEAGVKEMARLFLGLFGPVFGTPVSFNSINCSGGVEHWITTV